VDISPQVKFAPALAARPGTWLRDEEAAGSNPATPTQVTGHLRSSQVAISLRCVTNCVGQAHALAARE
jgi:hypothetical protein